ncbi:MAG: SemiSWEET transporter [Candidatus Aenigmatarchaeota archaeon]
MIWITLIGMLAAAATTVAFLPQVVRSWRTKKTEDISLLMYLTMVTGGGLWLSYGLLINDMPLIFANIITLSLTISTLFLKLKYK